MVAVVAEPIDDAPCPRVGVTVTGLGIADSTVTLWRAADGVRSPVRGAYRAQASDAAYFIDWDAPIGRPIRYELEVLAGPAGLGITEAAAVTLESDSGWIQDPLNPATAVPIVPPRRGETRAMFETKALRQLEYKADIEMFNVIGSDSPMALIGQRMRAAGVDFSMITDAAEENARLLELFMSSGDLLVRLPPHLVRSIPGTCFVAVANVSEQPWNADRGGQTTIWSLTGDTIQAPTLQVLMAVLTYGDVAILFDTYAEKMAAVGGGTYLDDLKRPLG